LVSLFTDTATDGTNVEVMGIIVAINSVSFGAVTLFGGALEGLSVGGPDLLPDCWMGFSDEEVTVQRDVAPGD
jgi:hypothetical protein